jgi:signal transduction histidine kinase
LEVIMEIKRNIFVFGQTKANIIIFNDLTNVVKEQREKASKISQELIIATTSHELKTPLNAIIGSLELLHDHVKKEGEEYFNVAKTSTQLMLSLVHDILDYS